MSLGRGQRLRLLALVRRRGDDVRHQEDQHRRAGERQTAGREIRFQQAAAAPWPNRPASEGERNRPRQRAINSPVVRIGVSAGRCCPAFLFLRRLYGRCHHRRRRFFAQIHLLAVLAAFASCVSSSRSRRLAVWSLTFQPCRTSSNPGANKIRPIRSRFLHAPKAAKLEIDGNDDQRREIDPRRGIYFDSRRGYPACSGSILRRVGLQGQLGRTNFSQAGISPPYQNSGKPRNCKPLRRKTQPRRTLPQIVFCALPHHLTLHIFTDMLT